MLAVDSLSFDMRAVAYVEDETGTLKKGTVKKGQGLTVTITSAMFAPTDW